MTDDSTAGKMRLAAMNFLARREYSRAELEERLARKFPDHQHEVAAVLDRLNEQGLQCDRRFAEAFCRSRIARGQGRLRIVTELRQKGIPATSADAALDSTDVDWFELAAEVARRRFGEGPPDSRKEFARRLRFLQYRGFNADQVRYALDALAAVDED